MCYYRYGPSIYQPSRSYFLHDALLFEFVPSTEMRTLFVPLSVPELWWGRGISRYPRCICEEASRGTQNAIIEG